MCLSIIFKSLYNIFYGSPPPEPLQEEQQDPWYTPPQEDTEPQYPPQDVLQMRMVALDQLVLGSNQYMGLRARANAERDLMNESFKQSHQAQSRADKAAAINRAKEHQRKMESLSKEASERIFNENNKRRRPGEIDLHDLHVEEAISFTDRAIQEAMQRGELELRLIVGKGRHSEGGLPKLKPAIQEHLQRHGIVSKVDPKNAGVLIIQIGSEETEESPLMSRM